MDCRFHFENNCREIYIVAQTSLSGRILHNLFQKIRCILCKQDKESQALKIINSRLHLRQMYCSLKILTCTFSINHSKSCTTFTRETVNRSDSFCDKGKSFSTYNNDIVVIITTNIHSLAVSSK